MFYSKPRWMIASIAIVSLVAFLFYQNLDIVKRSVNLASLEVTQYMQAEDHLTDISSKTSVGVRLEMMRAGFIFIKDNPIIGIGSGNYKKVTDTYIEEGIISPYVGEFAHPHNTFIEVASAKGLIGLISILLLFYFPAYIFIKDYKSSKITAIPGLIHIIAISMFSLTDHSIVLMNNYTSILLLGIVVFLSSHLRHASSQSKKST